MSDNNSWNNGTRAYSQQFPQGHAPYQEPADASYDSNPFNAQQPPSSLPPTAPQPQKPAPLKMQQYLVGEAVVALVGVIILAITSAVLTQFVGDTAPVAPLSIAIGQVVCSTIFLAIVLAGLMHGMNGSGSPGTYFLWLAIAVAAAAIILPRLSMPIAQSWPNGLMVTLTAIITIGGTYRTGRNTSQVPF